MNMPAFWQLPVHIRTRWSCIFVRPGNGSPSATNVVVVVIVLVLGVVVSRFSKY